MPAGGLIRLDATLALVFGKKVNETVTGMELSKGLWNYIKANGLQIKTEKPKAESAADEDARKPA